MGFSALSHCLICFKCDKNKGSTNSLPPGHLNTPKNGETCHKFFHLASQYFQFDPVQFPPEERINKEVSVQVNNACDDCASTMESLCKILEQLQILQLQASSSLQKIANLIMNSNDLIKSDNHVYDFIHFRSRLEDKLEAAGKTIENLESFRRNFLERGKMRRSRRRTTISKLAIKSLLQLFEGIRHLSPSEGLEKPSGERVLIVDPEMGVAVSTTTNMEDDHFDDYVPEDADIADYLYPIIPVKEEQHGQVLPEVPNFPLETMISSYSSQTTTTPVPQEILDHYQKMRSKWRKPQLCVMCGMIFRKMGHLAQHMVTHTREKPFFCKLPTCEKSFARSTSLRKHERDVHGIFRKVSTTTPPLRPAVQLLSCVMCDKVDIPPNKFESHIRTHTLERPFSCKICSKSFAEKSFLKIHVLAKHIPQKIPEPPPPKSERFKCDMCERVCQSGVHLRAHKLSHLGIKPYQCSECKKYFSRSEHLNLHVRVHHSNQENPYVCQYCNRSFAYQTSLTGHLRTHTGEKPYKCKVCGKDFAHSSSRLAHERMVHEKKEPYSKYKSSQVGVFVCEFCGKSFTFKNSLALHKRLHTKDQRYECQVCLKRYNTKSNLVDHQRAKHSDERPYQCEQCGKSFALKIILTKHERTHLAKISCKLCSKSFTSEKQVESHMRTHETQMTPEQLW